MWSRLWFNHIQLRLGRFQNLKFDNFVILFQTVLEWNLQLLLWRMMGSRSRRAFSYLVELKAVVSVPLWLGTFFFRVWTKGNIIKSPEKMRPSKVRMTMFYYIIFFFKVKKTVYLFDYIGQMGILKKFLFYL
jgi:hypothetical protein